MLKHIRVIFACIWFLLLTSMSHGFVEMDVFNATILIDTSEPIYNSYSFTGVSGSGTLTMKNGIMDDPSVDGVSSASITLNGVVVFDTGNFPGYGESSRRDITINEGANSLEIVSNGNVGAQFTIQIVQDWKEEASTVIGPGGGTLEVTDTESEALGVKIYVPENTFINDTELKISSFHSGIDTPLFPQYEEPVSTIVKLESSELPSSTVEICFPVIYFEDETYHRYELDEEVFEWNDSITDFEITLDNRGICAPIDHFSTYAITVKSNCSAPGGRFFSNNAEPTCRQKWESTIYQTILKPQLYMFAEKIYKNKIGSFLTPNDIVQASRATASQIAKLHDLNSKNIGEVWLQSRAEILQLAEKFFGNNFALIWFNFMLSALEEIAMGEPPPFDLTEEEVSTLDLHFNSLPLGEEKRIMNECRITIEFLKEYYHFGTNLEMLKDALGLLPAADKTDVIHAVAEQMGNSQDLPFTDYDIDRVLGIVNGSTALVNQFARLFTSPKASTGAASNITVNGATLNGNVSPSGLETTAWFEWGPTVKMSQRTSPQLADPGVIDQIIDDFLSGLSPMSIYYYRIVAENDTGMVKGSMIRFTTSGMPPSVATSYATSIGSSSALLNGSVIPNGLSTVTRFEWGTDPSLSTQIRTPSQNAGAGTSSNTMRYSLKNLTTGTTYYFRIVASNKAGIAVGPITSFTPQGLIVSTIPASGITTNSASIGGIVNAETASVKTWFEWGPDPTLSTYSITPETTVSAGTVSHTVNHRLVGLSSMSTYYFRIAASKESGTVKGSIMSFNTPGSPPTVSTLNATSVTTSAGVLNGSVNPSGLATEAWFEWGTDPSLSSPISTPRQSAGSGTTATSIGYSLNNLANNTTYYFRIAASNSAGKARGAIRNLNTSAIVIRNETTTLKWEAPTANEDGTPLQDLAGYKIYYGNSSRAYVSSQNVGNVTQYTLYNLPAGTWFFAVTAYDNAGNESIYSNEISKTIN